MLSSSAQEEEDTTRYLQSFLWVGALYLRYGAGGPRGRPVLRWIWWYCTPLSSFCVGYNPLLCFTIDRLINHFHFNQYLMRPLILFRIRTAQRSVQDVLDPHSTAATIFSVNAVWLEPRIICIFYGKQSFVISAFGALFPLVILFNLHCLGLSLCRVCIYVYNREYIWEESKEEIPVGCFAAPKSLQQCKPWLHPDCSLHELGAGLQW